MPTVKGITKNKTGDPFGGLKLFLHRSDNGNLLSSATSSDSSKVGDPDFSKVKVLFPLAGSIATPVGGSYSLVGNTSFVQEGNRQVLRVVGAAGEAGIAENANNPNLNIPGDYTIELKTKLEVGGVVINRFIPGSESGWQIEILSTGEVVFYNYIGGSGGTNLLRSGTVRINDNLLHHIAVTREGATTRLFIDGVLITSANSTTQYISATALLSIGYQIQGGSRYPYTGLISDVRITIGKARYTTNFTVPESLPLTENSIEVGDYEMVTSYIGDTYIVCKSPFEDRNDLVQRLTLVDDGTTGDPLWDKVELLLHFEGANDSQIYIDSSTKSRPISTYGGVSIRTDKFKQGTSSSRFNGNGHLYPTLFNQMNELTPRNGLDYTIESWVYISSNDWVGSEMAIAGQMANANGFNIIELTVNPQGQCQFGVYDGSPKRSVTPVDSFKFNQWNHLAGVKYGNEVFSFINGKKGTVVPIGTLWDVNDRFAIGRMGAWAGSQYFTGWMDELRITYAARWVDDFIPPDRTLPDF